MVPWSGVCRIGDSSHYSVDLGTRTRFRMCVAAVFVSDFWSANARPVQLSGSRQSGGSIPLGFLSCAVVRAHG